MVFGAVVYSVIFNSAGSNGSMNLENYYDGFQEFLIGEVDEIYLIYKRLS